MRDASSRPVSRPAPEANFLQGGGTLGALMRSHPWDQTPFGPIAHWPQSLRSALSICIGARFPIAIYWGAELALLYNDAWSPILGTKHPAALGLRGREVWPEIWPTIGPLFEQVVGTGEAVYQEDSLLAMHRHGYTEECYFNFTFSPIRGEGGRVEGIFNAVIETTYRVVAARRARVLRELGDRIAPARSPDQACVLTAQSLASAGHDVPFCALYLLDGPDGAARLAACSSNLVGSPAAAPVWPMAGKTVVVADVPHRIIGPAWPEPIEKALVVPIPAAPSGGPAGVLVLGASPRRAIDDDYRGFAERIAAQIASVVATATAFEAQRKRAEALAEIDRAKTAFFSNVSHEFRTPLTLMLGPTAQALASPDKALRGAELERVHRNALRLLKLVNALLDFSRIEAGRTQARFAPTDLGALVTDLASSFRSLLEKAGLRLTVDVAPDLPPVHVDRDLVEKIVLNLLSNAFKFTFEGGVEVGLRVRDGAAVLTVADTGTGIPPNALPHLFERFHRVEGAKGRSYEGSGIGLALVAELVKLHGGEVHVDSRVGAGTRFALIFPLGSTHLPSDQIVAGAPRAEAGPAVAAFVSEADQWGQPARAATQPAATAAQGHVLLADDNRDMREYVTQLLTAEGWSVDAVADGQTALRHARARVPDLVLTDVMMPGLDGFGLLAALRKDEATRRVPVVLLSARAGNEAEVEGLNAGADDYLVKPFAAAELVARVRTHLNGTLQRQQSLRVAEEERARMQSLLSQVPAVITFLRGPDLVVEFANANARQAFGPRPILGKPLREAAPEHADPPRADRLSRVFRTGQPISGQEARVHPQRAETGTGDETYWNYTYLPVRDRDGAVEGVMTFDLDVTDQVLARKHAEAVMAQMRVADARKDEFLAMLAHELRNPMAAISLALSLLQKSEGDPVHSARHRDTATRQMGNLVRLVDDLLDVSRITRGKVELRREPIDLAAIVQGAVTATRPAIEARGHTLTVTQGAGAFRLEADATRLEQVVVNLLTNAAKYTEPGGAITVDLAREDATAVVTVRDTGRGIPEPMLDKVFEMFVQVSPTIDRGTGGLGLGLTLVRRLVEMHGGTVVARSAGVGQGTSFVVRLPLPGEVAAAASSPAAASASPETPIVRRRILLIEDSQDIREALQEYLEELGHEVTVARNGLEGVEKLIALKPDVTLVDVGLPGIDGYEVARRARAAPACDRLYLVALTGYGGPAARSQARAAGFDLHLTKPIDVEQLSRVVNRPSA